MDSSEIEPFIPANSQSSFKLVEPPAQNKILFNQFPMPVGPDEQSISSYHGSSENEFYSKKILEKPGNISSTGYHLISWKMVEEENKGQADVSQTKSEKESIF